MALDIIFLSDGSKRSLDRYARYRKTYPHIKKCVTQLKGLDAFKQAGRMSMTASFFLINHHFELVDFDFSYSPSDFDKSYTHIWQYHQAEVNYCEDTKPGYNGVFLFSRSALRSDKTDLNEIGDGIKYMDQIASKEAALDVIVVSVNDPYSSRNQDAVRAFAPEAKRVNASSLSQAYQAAYKAAETYNFFVILNDYIPVDFDFSYKPPEYDAAYTHVWQDTEGNYGGILLLNQLEQSLFTDKDAFAFNFGSQVKYIDEKVSKHDPQPYDIIFMSYDEPNADQHFELLKAKYPYAKRVHGVDGILKAHTAASNLATTTNFFVVDGDSQLVNDFDVNVQLYEDEKQYVHIWPARIEANGLEYGYGGLKLFSKAMFEKDAIENMVDMSTILGSGVKIMDQVASVTKFDADELHAFRSAFRECTKLASKIIKNQDDTETEYRLNTWCTNARGQFADAILLGAKMGRDYGTAYAGRIKQLQKINDFEWLFKLYRDKRMNEKEQELLYEKYNRIDTKTLTNLTSLLYDREVQLTLNEIRDCFSRDQLLSKFWLIDELNKLNLEEDLTMMILGGWIGSLSNFMFQFYRDPDKIKRIVSVDIDHRCEKIADLFNMDNLVNGWRFKAITGDMMTLDYHYTSAIVGDEKIRFHADWNMLINTSCEHIDDLPEWFKRIPKGKLMVVQSNNYFEHEQHVNSVPSLEAFEEQCDFEKILFKGTLPCQMYDRYMIIGIR